MKLAKIKQLTREHVLATYLVSEELYEQHEGLILHLLHSGRKVVRDQVRPFARDVNILDCFNTRPNLNNVCCMFENEVIDILWF